jgi:hypothetical protein
MGVRWAAYSAASMDALLAVTSAMTTADCSAAEKAVELAGRLAGHSAGQSGTVQAVRTAAPRAVWLAAHWADELALWMVARLAECLAGRSVVTMVVAWDRQRAENWVAT